MFKILGRIQIGILHAKFHKNMKLAEAARIRKDVVEFRDYIYTAEDAWKKIVAIKQKYNI